MKTIDVIVSPTGEARIETRGFTGGDCREASRFIEQALGQPVSEKLTGEYFFKGPIEQVHVGGRPV